MNGYWAPLCVKHSGVPCAVYCVLAVNTTGEGTPLWSERCNGEIVHKWRDCLSGSNEYCGKEWSSRGMENHGRVSILGRGTGALHAETWVTWRGAQCDSLDEALSRSCGREERGRTSLWLEGREEGRVVGEEVEELHRTQIGWELGFYSQLWWDATEGFWAGEKHALNCEEGPAGKHVNQGNEFNVDIYWKGEDRAPWCIGSRGWGKVTKHDPETFGLSTQVGGGPHVLIR